MSLVKFVPFSSVRILEILIVLNLIYLGFKVLKNSWIYFAAVFFYLLHAFFFLDLIYVKTDLINIAWWTTFALILNYHVRNFEDYQLLKSTAIKLSFLWASLAAVIGLYKLYSIIQGNLEDWMYYVKPNGALSLMSGSSLNSDYNVYSIGLYCGFFSGLYLYHESNNALCKATLASFLLIIVAAAISSTSRRAVILSPVILAIYILSDRNNLIAYNRSIFRLKLTRPKWHFIPWKTVVLTVVTLLLIPKLDVQSIYNKSDYFKSYLNRIATVGEITSKERDTRSVRWLYAWKYYLTLPIENKLLGDGFQYVKKMGSRFREASIDHPHNLFMSSLVYGGILGLVATIGLVFYTIYLHIKIWERKSVFAMWFFLVLFLSFTSSNSIFSSRLGITLLLLPMLNFWRLKKVNQKQLVHYDS
jgi:O-antigen ligase